MFFIGVTAPPTSHPCDFEPRGRRGRGVQQRAAILHTLAELPKRLRLSWVRLSLSTPLGKERWDWLRMLWVKDVRIGY